MNATSRLLHGLVLLFLLVGQSARAQELTPNEFRFEHLTVDQGLAHSDATAVVQDREGFIWVGTTRGLDRYDGYGLKHYKLPLNLQTGFSSNRIRVLHVARDGRLWVGTERDGLSVYDAATDQLRRFQAEQLPSAYQALARRLATSNVTALASDSRGRLWVGTSLEGVLVLTFDARGHPISLRQVPPAAGQPDNYQVSSLVVDKEDKVWFGTYAQGLHVVRPDNPDLTAEATPLTGAVLALHLDRRGDMWIGTDQQVLWVSAANRHQVRELSSHPQPLRYPRLQSLLLDSFGRLWVGTTYGLYLWEAGPVTGTAPPLRAGAPTLLLPRDGQPFSINSERVRQVFEDHNQLVWLCTSAGGLNKVNLLQKPFGWLRRPLAARATLPYNYVNAIYTEEDRNLLWFGTRNGVSGYDLQRKTYSNYLNQQADGNKQGTDVASVFKTSNGRLWFGTRGHGLTCLTRHDDRQSLTTYTQLPGGPDLSVGNLESMAEDRYGTLWLTTSGAGLVRLGLDGKFLGNYQLGNHRLPTNTFTYLLYDRHQDVLWASSDQGLFKLRVTPDSLVVLRQFRHRPGATTGLRVDYVWPLLLDRQGTLWIGTIGGGLHQLTTTAQGRDTIRSMAEYLPESDVESLLADDAGNLWVGGTGLYRFTPSTRVSLHYDVADGLQSNAFKVGAAARAQDGTLYFGGINGISYFQPRAILPNPYAPVMRLTGLRIANQPVAVGQLVNGRVLLARPLSEPQTVVIRPGDNDFAVDFVGLNYANPQKDSYAYQLLGYNTGWVVPAAGQRTATFANLPPGHYTFQVKASNGEGKWSPPTATMQFEVLAPWYKTGWAYLAYAALALGAVALYRRFEMAQQRLQSKLTLEQFQAEKEKELTTLKLGFFTNVSHELRTPLTLILGPVEEIVNSPGPVVNLREKMLLLQKQAHKLLELVNQLLDFRKVETGHVPLRASYGDATLFLAEQFAVFKLKAEERRMAYQLDLPTEPVKLYFDRSKLEIILTNLLANAFKFTREGGRVVLSAAVVGSPDAEAVYAKGVLTGNYLRISVSDTGVGIPLYELDRVFDPYYQATQPGGLRANGTGIGLALARQFAERHGGQLSVSSVRGEGTTFELRLPFGQQHLLPEDIQLDDAPLATLPPAPELSPLVEELATTSPAAAGPPRLLIVEDNEDVRNYLTQLFEGEYAVTTAEDGLVGWEKALSQLPDLIISDIMMPRSDGLELCQKIKQHPKTAHIPTMLLTARTAETHQLEGLGLGADDYISKPFTPSLLLARADALLRNRRKLHEFYQRNILLQPTEIVVADADREFLEKAMGVVEQHLNDSGFNVQVLIQEMAMSQSVLYRRIKSLTGQTAVEFIRDVRLKRAAQLLAQTTMRIAEVAFTVGIENAQYFRESFQKRYNLTPSEYAKQHRQRPAAQPSATEAD